MITRMKLFLFLLFFSSYSFAQLLEQVKEGIESGQVLNPEAQLNQLRPKDEEFLPARLFMMNRRYQNLETELARKHAKIGYKYSVSDSDLEFMFYDKLIRNKLFVEAGLTQGTLYDTKSLFAEYSRNYESTDWFKVNVQIENRTDKPSSVSTQGVNLGVGHIMVLDKYSYLDSNLSFGTLQDSFLPNYSISNELFYGPNNNTFSLRVKYNSFNSSSATFISPHWRYDFDPLYIGLRGNLTLAEITPAYAGQIYGGFKTIRWKTELSFTKGQSIENNILNKKIDYSQWDASLNYRLNPTTEIGFRVMDYNSSTMKQNGYFLNLLFRY